MPDTTQFRSSHDTVLPGDVTDPLLWRTAYDVAAAHQPDETGCCPSLLCGGRTAPCDTLVRAEQAMRLARAGAPAEAPAASDDTAAPLRGNRRRAA